MRRSELNRKVQEIYQERAYISGLKQERAEAEFLEQHPDFAEALKGNAQNHWNNAYKIIANAKPKEDYLTNLMQQVMDKNSEKEHENSLADTGNELTDEEKLLDEQRLLAEQELSGEAVLPDENEFADDFSDLISEDPFTYDPEVYKEFLAIKNKSFYCPSCQDKGKISDGSYCPLCFNAVWQKVLRSNIAEYLPVPKHDFAHADLNIFSNKEVTVAKNKSINPRKQIELNYQLAHEFVDNFPSKNDNLLFSGQPGTGKTYLAECIGNALLAQNFLPIMVTTLTLENIINNLRIKEKSFSVKDSELYKAESDYSLLIEADLLIIDDFGIIAGVLHNPLAEILNILQARKNKGKQTIITTNYNFVELKRIYDERLISRLLENFSVTPFVGDDIRIRIRRR